jgi:hypothetical protein
LTSKKEKQREEREIQIDKQKRETERREGNREGQKMTDE